MRESKRKILLFGGTTEGRLLAQWLAGCQWPTVACVATAYGREALEETFRNSGGNIPGEQAGQPPGESAVQAPRGSSGQTPRGSSGQTPGGSAAQAPGGSAVQASGGSSPRTVGNCVDICQGRLDLSAMKALLEETCPGLVIDATHPYAAMVTENIRKACAGRKGLGLIRCLREDGDIGLGSGLESANGLKIPHCNAVNMREEAAQGDFLEVIHVAGVELAVQWLAPRKGNILVTTGSKELAAFCGIDDYRQRVYVRVLPSAEAVEMCRGLGYQGRHVIAMQGPFSENMNLALLREYDCRFLVTKDGGGMGGFEEKIRAAKRAGAVSVVIDRPGGDRGVSLEAVKQQVKEWMDHEKG